MSNEQAIVICLRCILIYTCMIFIIYIIYFFLGKCGACKQQRKDARERKMERNRTETCSLFALAAAASPDRRHLLSVNMLNVISVYRTTDRAILGL